MGEIDLIAGILHGYPQNPRYLLAILLDIQEQEKYLSKSAMHMTAEYLGVPDSRVYAVATFYSTLSLKKKGRVIVRVCMGTACHLRGSASALSEFERLLGIKNKGTTDDGKYTLETVNCVGACALAPVITTEQKTFTRVMPSGVADLLAGEELL